MAENEGIVTKKCPFCAEEINEEAKKCRFCGETLDVTLRVAEEAKRANSTSTIINNNNNNNNNNDGGFHYPPKSRAVYIVLALLLGGLGIHNFYAGRTGSGIAQLLISLLLGWLLFPLIIVGLWVIIEMIAVTTDGHGQRFA